MSNGSPHRVPKLHLVPLTLQQANEHVAAWHRHNRPTVGHKFSVGAADENGVLRAVCIVGRPVARKQDDGQTLEVLRVASDGSRNANSLLYGAAARAGFAMGYTRLITYTQADESGSSLRASGWKCIAHRPPNKGWSMPSRPRKDIGSAGVARQLWEVETDAPSKQERLERTADEVRSWPSMLQCESSAAKQARVGTDNACDGAAA